MDRARLAMLAGLLAWAFASGAAVRAEEPAPEPGSPFPTPEALEDLAQEPLPRGAFEGNAKTVESWKLTGPFPERIGARSHEDPSPWGGLLQEAAERRAGLVVGTEAMHCAAREWGLFFMDHAAPPASELSGYLGVRCGAVAPGIRFYHFEGGIPADAPEDEVFEAWREPVEQILNDRLVGGPLTAGIWFGRRGGRAIAVVAAGERRVRVDPISTVPEGEAFEIRGELLIAADAIGAAVNRGDFDSLACEQDEEVALPRFAFRCEVDRRDARSYLAIHATEPGKLLSTSLLINVLWPGGEPSSEWQRPRIAGPTPLAPEADVAEAVLEKLNHVRKRAGRRELTLARKQSEVADVLAPYFFASIFGITSPSHSELVTLGMLAGWEVEGDLYDGDFASSWVSGSTDVDHLVARALQYPSGRRSLLDPQAQQIAIGTVVNEDVGMFAGMFATYSTFERSSYDEAAGQVLEALDTARALAGKPPVRHLTKVASLTRLSARRIQGGEDANDVLGDLMQQCTRVLNRGVSGWILTTADPAAPQFPKALLEENAVELAIGVSHHQKPGEPWARYVILMVAAAPDGQGA